MLRHIRRIVFAGMCSQISNLPRSAIKDPDDLFTRIRSFLYGLRQAFTMMIDYFTVELGEDVTDFHRANLGLYLAGKVHREDRHIIVLHDKETAVATALYLERHRELTIGKRILIVWSDERLPEAVWPVFIGQAMVQIEQLSEGAHVLADGGGVLEASLAWYDEDRRRIVRKSGRR